MLWLRLNRSPSEITVKLALPRSAMSSGFERTAALHQFIVQNSSVLIGDILAVDTSCQRVPYRYLIKSYLAGQEWAKIAPLIDDTQRSKVFRQIGRAVAELHKIALPCFGEINFTQPSATLGYLDALIQRAQTPIQAHSSVLP